MLAHKAAHHHIAHVGSQRRVGRHDPIGIAGADGGVLHITHKAAHAVWADHAAGGARGADAAPLSIADKAAHILGAAANRGIGHRAGDGARVPACKAACAAISIA